MTDFLLGAAAFVVALVAIGLFRTLRGPGIADRMMAVQLLGAGGIAALLLAEARGVRGATDVALALAVLAAFASIVLAKDVLASEHEDSSGADQE